MPKLSHCELYLDNGFNIRDRPEWSRVFVEKPKT